jgi:DeoR family transcriptional regulator, suf operon transcriptional repressor
VAVREERGGRGRPKHWFGLTRDAEGFFPKAYGGLTNELLGYVTEADPELVERIFERRRQRRVEQARVRLGGLAFAAKVRELARILDEDGYLADFEACPDGTFRVTEHNCAVLDVAERYGGACSSEIAFLREALPEARIERVSHMIAGAHSCAYVIEPRPREPGRSGPVVAPA